MSASAPIATNRKNSGKRELHPYVRPGICSIILAFCCFFLAIVTYKLAEKYKQPGITCDQFKILTAKSFLSESCDNTVVLCLCWIMGITCSLISVFYLIKKTLEAENEKRRELKYHCHDVLKPRDSEVSCRLDQCQTTECTLTPNETQQLTPKEDKQRRRQKAFRGISFESLSWKSFSKSILVESDDAQMQNELLITELSRALKEESSKQTETKSKGAQETEENHYFQIPFNRRLEIEEFIKRKALDGITRCNCHKCSFCHCHIRGITDNLPQASAPSPPDFDALYVA